MNRIITNSKPPRATLVGLFLHTCAKKVGMRPLRLLRSPNSLVLTFSTSSFKPLASLTPSSSRRCLASRARTMDATALAYSKWTKVSLVNRIRELENALKAQTASSDQPPSAAAEVPAPGEGGGQKKGPKKTKVLNRSKYSTRFIALKLAYIGKNYNGFEYQSSGALSTIEEELWKALVKACLVFPDPARPHEVDWSVCEYSKCGRTDRGVSAFGQVVALRVRSNKPARPNPVAAQGVDEGESTEDVGTTDGGVESSRRPAGAEEGNQNDDDAPFPIDKEIQYCRMLNRLLPPDIRVYAWCPDPGPGFSARFNCRERQYRYFFTQPAFAPLPNFLEDNDYYYSGGSKTDGNDEKKKKKEKSKPKDGWLDIDAMRQAANLFEGLHDFRNFCKIDPSKQITNFTRRIFEADIVEVDGVDTRISYLTGPQFRDPNIVASSSSSSVEQQRCPKVYYFHVRGSAFLWHQIRCMVAILFLVGQGLEPPSVVSTLLDAAQNPRRPNYVLAEDAPLVLWDCIFGRDNAEGTADELDWLYVGGARARGQGAGGGGDSPLNLHGPGGLAADLWESWHAKKMDEILANQLVDWLSRKTDVHRVPSEDEVAASGESGQIARLRTGRSTRVYEGGDEAKFAGQYVPVLKKNLVQSPEELNDRFAQRRGFKNAEEMRAIGNWREAIRAAKMGEGAEDVAGE